MPHRDHYSILFEFTVNVRKKLKVHTAQKSENLHNFTNIPQERLGWIVPCKYWKLPLLFKAISDFLLKNFSNASSINHSPYFPWDFENKHFGNTFLNINEEDISKDILYITIKDLLYLSNSYDILEYRILYFIFCILSQFVLTLLQYYFSFFQANFPVSLSLPICRVLNPGKVHILYITFTHNILYMAKKMCACIDQGWGNVLSGKFCVRTKSIKP